MHARGAASGSSPNEPQRSVIDALAAIDTWPVDHVAAAVVAGDGTITTRGATAHPFRLASVTKMLTATAVLVAVEECVIGLDDPVDERGATMRQLLSHAAGYPFEGRAPVAAPRRRRIYSNTGIELAAAAVEAAAGIPFATYFAEAVVEPLGLGVELRGSPAHGGVTSLEGLLPFVADQLRPGLLAATTAADARTVQYPELNGIVPGIGNFQPCPWGLGCEIRGTKSPHWTSPRCSAATFGHFGGAGTLCWVDPEADIALVALTDRAFDDWSIDAMRLWPALGDAVLAASATGAAGGHRA